MELVGRHFFLIVLVLYFVYETVGVRIAKWGRQKRFMRQLRKQRVREEKARKKLRKELLRLEREGIRRESFAKFCRGLFLVLVFVAVAIAPYSFDIVGNVNDIPGWEGASSQIAPRLLFNFGIFAIIFGTGAYLIDDRSVSLFGNDREWEQIGWILLIVGVIGILWVIWILFWLWLHQLWNGGEQWWTVFIGIVISGWLGWFREDDSDGELDWESLLEEEEDED